MRYKLHKSLYFWILLAFALGSFWGWISPKTAILLEPLGTNFIKLIKVFIPPIVFMTVATGIAQTGSLKKLGKVGLKAILYFEVVSTFALCLGWGAATLIQPGANIHAHVADLDPKKVASFLQSAEKLSFVDYIQGIIPTSVVEPFVKGDMLQVLLLAILFGVSLLAVQQGSQHPLLDLMEKLTKSLFRIIQLVMYLAPIGVLGAMAFTVGKFGSQFLIPLFSLIATFYVAALLFVFVVLGLIAKWSGFSLIRFLRHMSTELILILGTSSSESALPQLLDKLQKMGCRRDTVGVVVPMGYAFNLDGTNIYITLAALFIAQALGIDLTIGQQLVIFLTAMLTSKGAAGITGAGFVTLAATLSVVPSIPAVGIVLILGVDRFMSEARALVNFIGNGVAALAISRWENEISAEQLEQSLSSK